MPHFKFNKRLVKPGLFTDSAFGWDGLSTFIFSNLLLLSTFGLIFFWLLGKIIKTAMETKTSLSEPMTVLIAGLCLDNNKPVEEFKVRLNRAIALQKCFKDGLGTNLKFILLGGLTGANQISEAQAGADYLIAHGIDARRIILEDQSRHTLENMQQAQILLLGEEFKKHLSSEQQNGLLSERSAIISSRYHLYRVLTLARDLQLTLQPIAAENTYAFSFLMWRRVLKEAYYLHWYWSGKLYLAILNMWRKLQSASILKK